MYHVEDLRLDPDRDTSLASIMSLVDMRGATNIDGWNGESARLFAIDLASIMFRRRLILMDVSDQSALIALFNEARRLVVADREDELGAIQYAMEGHLALARTGAERLVWLVAIDSLLPSPFRAALATARTAVETDDDIADYISDRIEARLSEGSMLAMPTSTLFQTA